MASALYFVSQLERNDASNVTMNVVLCQLLNFLLKILFE